MTNELKKITKRIDNEFLKYFLSDIDMETIFVVGSMAKDDYQDNMDNEYDIRIVCKEVNAIKIINFEKFLENLSKNLTNENIEVGCSSLIGPINNKISHTKKNILIHAILYDKNLMDNLPLTHKYQYGNRYRIIYGKDTLKQYKDIVYEIDDIVNGYEGLNYCIDMLKRQEKRYLAWSILREECELKYYIVPLKENEKIEICFSLVNKFIDNLMDYCKMNNYDIPEDKVIFCIRLLGQANINENTLFLLQGLFTRSESMLKAIFANPLKETLSLLELFKLYINHLDNVFPKKEEKKLMKI